MPEKQPERQSLHCLRLGSGWSTAAGWPRGEDHLSRRRKSWRRWRGSSLNLKVTTVGHGAMRQQHPRGSGGILRGLRVSTSAGSGFVLLLSGGLHEEGSSPFTGMVPHGQSLWPWQLFKRGLCGSSREPQSLGDAARGAGVTLDVETTCVRHRPWRTCPRPLCARSFWPQGGRGTGEAEAGGGRSAGQGWCPSQQQLQAPPGSGQHFPERDALWAHPVVSRCGNSLPYSG